MEVESLPRFALRHAPSFAGLPSCPGFTRLSHIGFVLSVSICRSQSITYEYYCSSNAEGTEIECPTQTTRSGREENIETTTRQPVEPLVLSHRPNMPPSSTTSSTSTITKGVKGPSKPGCIPCDCGTCIPALLYLPPTCTIFSPIFLLYTRVKIWLKVRTTNIKRFCFQGDYECDCCIIPCTVM